MEKKENNIYSGGKGLEIAERILAGDTDIRIDDAEEFATWLVANPDQKAKDVVMACHSDCLEGRALPWQQTVTAVNEAFCLHIACKYKDESEAFAHILKLLLNADEVDISDTGSVGEDKAEDVTRDDG